MNTIFGLPRTVVALAGIVVAIILVVVIGLIIIGSAAIRAMMAPGVKAEGVSLLALLVTIIVLLTAVFIMLLVVFWCCCKKMRSGKDHQLPPDMLAQLLPLLPLLPDIRNVMRDIGVALYASGKTIKWMDDRMNDAAGFITNVANDARDATTIKTELKILGVWVGGQEINPLAALEGNLRTVVQGLNPGTDPLSLGGSPVHVGEVGTGLENAGRTLAGIATSLGASPPPPNLP